MNHVSENVVTGQHQSTATSYRAELRADDVHEGGVLHVMLCENNGPMPRKARLDVVRRCLRAMVDPWAAMQPEVRIERVTPDGKEPVCHICGYPKSDDRWGRWMKHDGCHYNCGREKADCEAIGRALHAQDTMYEGPRGF